MPDASLPLVNVAIISGFLETLVHRHSLPVAFRTSTLLLSVGPLLIEILDSFVNRELTP